MEEGINIKIILLFLLFFASVGYACDPLPDYIILEKDTLELRQAYIPTAHLFKPLSRYKRKLILQGGSSTACHVKRDLWEIRNDSLFLDTLIACNSVIYLFSNETFAQLLSDGVPESTVSKIKPMANVPYESYWELCVELEELLSRKEFRSFKNTLFGSAARVPGHIIPLKYNELLKREYRNRNIFADFYTGVISVEVGEIIDSMMVHWHSVSDKELFFEIKNGIVVDTFTVSGLYNDHIAVRESINMSGFKLPVFDNWVKQDSLREEAGSMVLFRDGSTTISYKAVSTESKWEKLLLYSEVNQIIDAETADHSAEYRFSERSYLKLLYNGAVRGEWEIPYLASIAGSKNDSSHFKKSAVLFTYSKRVIIEMVSSDKAQLDDLYDKMISNIDCAWIEREQ